MGQMGSILILPNVSKKHQFVSPKFVSLPAIHADVQVDSVGTQRRLGIVKMKVLFLYGTTWHKNGAFTLQLHLS